MSDSFDALTEARRKHQWRLRNLNGGTKMLAGDFELVFTIPAFQELLCDARSKPELKLADHGLVFRGTPVRVEGGRRYRVRCHRTF